MIADIGIGDVVRHFKGNLYKIIAFGQHSETGEKEVVYQALYPPFDTWVRSFDNFMSEIDHEKYPDEKQKYRFEVMTTSDLAKMTAEDRFKNKMWRIDGTLITSSQVKVWTEAAEKILQEFEEREGNKER